MIDDHCSPTYRPTVNNTVTRPDAATPYYSPTSDPASPPSLPPLLYRGGRGREGQGRETIKTGGGSISNPPPRR